LVSLVVFTLACLISDRRTLDLGNAIVLDRWLNFFLVVYCKIISVLDLDRN
jgi:hypothetical protein